MRDHDTETKKDGSQGAPPFKAKTGGEQDREHKHADAHVHPDILRDERIAHPANAEPLAELLSQLQHSHGNAYVQRFVGESGGEGSQEAKPATESQALDAGVRSQMESAFGENFGDVRVHTGKHAGEVAGELGARAFTHGRDIYFKEGEYDPSTREGRELLAHELTHVVQQRGGTSALGTSVGAAGDTFEREADDVAAQVLRGERAHVERRSAASDIQRQQPPLPSPQTITAHPVETLVPNTLFLETFRGFGVHVYFSSIEGAVVDTIHVSVPARVSVTVVDLSGQGMQVYDPGGQQGSRVIVIRVNRRPGSRLIQVTYSKDNTVDIATYQLPHVPPAAAVTAAASQQSGGSTGGGR